MEENNMAANVVETANPQTTEVQTETPKTPPTTTESGQPATEVQGEQVTETQAFSKRLNEMSQKAIDAEYSRLFGADYGIHTKADYDKAIAERQAEEERARLKEETGFDPNELKPIFEEWKKTDPDFQELSKARQKQYLDSALTEFNSEMKDLGLEIELKSLDTEELNKLTNVGKITDLVGKGYSLTDAYFLANKKDILGKKAIHAQQEVIQKINANGQSSPGSLSAGGESEVFFTKDQVDKMSQTEVNKNYNLILKSMKKWK